MTTKNTGQKITSAGSQLARENKELNESVYGAYCAQVCREDTLISNRLSWLLTTEGLLFGALSIIATSQTDKSVDQVLVTALKQSLPIMGILIPVSVFVTIVLANISLSRLQIKWDDVRSRYPSHPNPFGIQQSNRYWLNGLGPSSCIPISIVAVWVYILYRWFPY